MKYPPTPGQTVGPFFHDALPYFGGSDLVPPGHPGRIHLHGTVFDGAGTPIPDALVEIWQADAGGSASRATGSLRRDGFTFTGFGRAATDGTGGYSFSTVAPGPIAPASAAFFSVCVFARGLLDRLLTRAYLPGDDASLAADPLLVSLPPERRSTLIAAPDAHGFVFDIRLQGEGETVFLWHGSR
ncbi:protocatechuate 3,4-dioxygenase subunit alpha [Nocardioides immobilis]|uniref:Protocatechuate 3,4-dioxygenase subunit alpha n=1 Tax=Nocardioides immobilis TaxID=2049295 RepID=A0A417XUD6_9ACTN|nr:protocatechuate 3,4-dioxygenase subunit alpha [Nocardioides immobilis]RHW24062.1 protocatechuate 3,4-dioxygenase subunit alpha [Nocardioides immobilis]